jgi:hypothetical protein
LQEHSLVRVLHPKWIMDDVLGHAPQTTLLKSSFRHVSAAVHANELIPGSAPAQQRVARGSTYHYIPVCTAILVGKFYVGTYIYVQVCTILMFLVLPCIKKSVYRLILVQLRCTVIY